MDYFNRMYYDLVLYLSSFGMLLVYLDVKFKYLLFYDCVVEFMKFISLGNLVFKFCFI